MVVGVDAANGTEVMFRGSGAPLVEGQMVRAPEDANAVERGRDGYSAAAAAERTIAAPCRPEAIGQSDLYFHGAAMAGQAVGGGDRWQGHLRRRIRGMVEGA